MTPAERTFLRTLAAEPQGRCSYSLLDYERVVQTIPNVLERGFVKHRRYGIREGLQITEAGKQYIGGMA